MRFRLSILILFAVLLPGWLPAGRTGGFSMSAFNVVAPSVSRNVVFSPVAYEFDCALISEAFGPIEKAAFVEALGALVGYDSVYKPISERYAAGTNGFSLVSGKALLVSSLKLVTPKYRAFLQSEYRAHVCPVLPSAAGAESFLRASMDGGMEDFKVSDDLKVANGVSFCDLESFRCLWLRPFPVANTRRSVFVTAEGVSREVEMMSDRREAGIWRNARFSVLRLPMSDGAFFFAVLPAAGVSLASVRGDFAATKFDEAVLMFRAVADPSVTSGFAAVTMPKFAMDAVVDMKPAFTAARLPLGGFKEISLGADATLGAVFQRTRFVLDECGCDGPCREETAAGVDIGSFVCDRPFLFFVYHEPTRTVPVAGVYAGD